jgi:hypothetical protein
LPTKRPHPNPPQICRHQPVATSLSLAPQPGAMNCKEPKSKIKNKKIKNQKLKSKVNQYPSLN